MSRSPDDGDGPAASPLGDTPAAVRASLERLLLDDAAGAALQALHDQGTLTALLPEVAATVDLAQEMGRRHKDVWAHTKQVIEQAARTPAVRWAALLHDVGKVPTRALTPQGKVTFYGHPEVSARMFDRVAARLAFPARLAADVRFLIFNHQRASQYEASWTDSAVRRFAREMGERLPELLLLARADVTSARPEKQQQAARSIDELERRIAELREQDSRRPPLPSGIGNEIMQRFGLAPGRRIGELKRELEELVEQGALEPYRESQYYLDALAARSTQLADAAGEPR